MNMSRGHTKPVVAGFDDYGEWLEWWWRRLKKTTGYWQWEVGGQQRKGLLNQTFFCIFQKNEHNLLFLQNPVAAKADWWSNWAKGEGALLQYQLNRDEDAEDDDADEEDAKEDDGKEDDAEEDDAEEDDAEEDVDRGGCWGGWHWQGGMLRRMMLRKMMLRMIIEATSPAFMSLTATMYRPTVSLVRIV